MRKIITAYSLAILLEIVVLITAIMNLVSKQWSTFAMCILAIVCIPIPFIITNLANKAEMKLPPSFQLVTVSFIFLAQYIGEILDFYQKIWWWDLFLHAIFGSYAVIVALYLAKGIIQPGEKASTGRYHAFLVMIAFNFSITLGTLWELFEFIGDYLVKSNMVKGGLIDTATDLIVKTIAAFITSIYYHRYRIAVWKKRKGEEG